MDTQNTKQIPKMGRQRAHDLDMINRLESMPFEEAREKILKGDLGSQLGSPNHDLFLSWLSLKESKLRDERESRTLRWARHAAYAAYAAAIIAAISIIITIIMPFVMKSP